MQGKVDIRSSVVRASNEVLRTDQIIEFLELVMILVYFFSGKKNFTFEFYLEVGVGRVLLVVVGRVVELGEVGGLVGFFLNDGEWY